MVNFNEVKIFPFLNPYQYLPEFSDPPNPENVRSHSSNSNESTAPLYSMQSWKCEPVQRHIPISLLLGITPPPPTTPSRRKMISRGFILLVSEQVYREFVE